MVALRHGVGRVGLVGLAAGLWIIGAASPSSADFTGDATYGGARTTAFDRAELREIKARAAAEAAAKAPK
jgi:hypothetical protein